FINEIAFDAANPATIYASSNLGLHKSTDGGNQWTFAGAPPPANGFQPAVLTFASDPKTPSVIYLVTNFGIYKSVNGGRSFELKNNGLLLSSPSAVAIDPVTPTTLYAAGFQGVFKSVDGAESWRPINTGLTGQASAVGRLLIDPVRPATVYAATNRGVFKTINGGTNWSSANNGLQEIGGSGSPAISALAMDPTNPVILFAGVQNGVSAAYKTTNGGVSWQAAGTGLQIGISGFNFPLPLTALAISPANSSVIYASSNFGVWKSVDGGATWSADSKGVVSPAIRALAADAQGNVFAGANPGSDAFVAQLNPAGSALEFARYLGGAQDDIGYGVAVDAANNIWIAGVTGSTDFPVNNALQATNGGGFDAFATKLSPAGAILFSTYLGGGSADVARGIALDAVGNVYLTGSTLSANFPQANPLHARSGGSNDAFVAKIKADGSGLAYSTYLGGARNDQAFGIAADNNGGVWVTGISESADFPVVNPLYPVPTFNPDAFVAHLNAAGSRLLFSTYIGGSGTEQGNGIAVDATGNAYVTGTTNSSDFPVLKSLQTYGGSSSDAFVLKLAAVADLAVAINESRDPVMVNNNLIYTLTVTNKGPDNALAVTLTDTLPAGVAFVSATAGQGNCSGSATVTCNLGEVEANAAVTVTITVRPSATGTLDNRATVSSATPDSTLENNSAMEQTRVSRLPSIAGLATQAGGAGVGGVMVGLSGAQTVAAMTNAAGFYQFSELTAGGNYNVTPARQGFVFNPPSRSFTNVTQDQTANFTAVACLFAITPVNRAFSANGGTASVAISSPDPQCPWTARTSVPWITVTSAAGGNGNGMVTFNVAATTVARSGTLTIAGRIFTVWQETNVCGLPDFVTAKSVVAGNAPLIAVSADFNRDGKTDVAVANDDSKIAVLLGAAGGGFGEPVSFNSVSRFTALATGDFNGDGNADLAATFFDRSNNVVVHLGTGAGTFGAARIFSADALPSALTVADFNGDNKQDLAVANEDASNVSILFGMGDGGFMQAMNLGGQGRPFRPKSIVAGDFTGDGKADVVVTGANNLELIPGNGQGGFGAMVSLNAGFNPGFIAAEDLNADGRLDLAVGNTFEGRGNVSILLANASGGFNAPANITLTELPLGGVPHLVVGDLNADGKKDLVATVPATASIIPLLGDGAGKFTLSASFTSGLTPRAAVLGEFTGDGKTDVLAVIGRINGNGLLSLFPGDGAGGLIAARNYAAPFQPRQLVNADFTGDGKTDLLILGGTCQLTNCAGNGSVMLRAGNGVGGFNVGSEFEVGNNPIAMVTGDFNNDGKPDVAAANAGFNNVSILLNNGNGGFGSAMNISVAAQPRAIATGDFNNDGKNDLVVTHVAPAINQILTVLLGNGAGGFSNPMTITSTQPFFSVEAADVNGDGNADLVASNYSSASGGSNPQRGIYVLPGNGGGGFGAARQISTELATEMELFDFNGDGLLDIAAATGDDKLSILFGTGAGNFAAPVIYALRSVGSLNAGSRALVPADVNSDGRPDVIVTNSGTESVEILLGNGVGGFGVPLAFWVGRQSVSVTAGDFNGDGRMDLATANANSTATVLLNACLLNGNAPATTVSAAAFTRPLTGEAIAAVFGVGLATSTQVATTIPLPVSLGGTTVRVRDGNATERFAPLFFVSPGQINFLIPPGTAVGTAVITITSGNGTISVGTASINDSAPALFTANGDGQSVAAATVLRVKADGSLLYEPVARFDSALNRFVPVPIDFGADLGSASDRLFLVLFGTGLRNRSSSFLQVKIGELTLGTLYAGPQGDFVGLDQINVQLPRSSALRGETDLKLNLENSFSNTVKISFK
ncbi:MAG TPA: FG-GAP-like repeat-containing protein, partial [Blastocatellia bacterium]|nr:FG-GAP-like repeat-containing protein [Blastocatellia bacterium]